MRIGVDLGGTKAECVVLGSRGETLWRGRVPTPRNDYDATVAAVRDLVLKAESETGVSCTVGVGIPGSLIRSTGLTQNSNLTWINRRPFGADLSEALDRTVHVANDANCFALSEAVDGAAAGHRSVFGVIIGTGCGGGLVYDGRIVDGPNGTGGEWGHIPLPWPKPEEFPGPSCWCGRPSCMEVWVAGPALERDHADVTGERLKAPEIYARRDDDPTCRASLDRHIDRLGRGIALIIDIFDPDIIVLGGGLSNMQHLYRELPAAAAPFINTPDPVVNVVPPKFGDSSGVRGAAWLWDESPEPA